MKKVTPKLYTALKSVKKTSYGKPDGSLKFKPRDRTKKYPFGSNKYVVSRSKAKKV